ARSRIMSSATQSRSQVQQLTSWRISTPNKAAAGAGFPFFDTDLEASLRDHLGAKVDESSPAPN
ncbi:hypothetical protein NDU88_006417, partial [Pleurodeles waltl]